MLNIKRSRQCHPAHEVFTPEETSAGGRVGAVLWRKWPRHPFPRRLGAKCPAFSLDTRALGAPRTGGRRSGDRGRGHRQTLIEPPRLTGTGVENGRRLALYEAVRFHLKLAHLARQRLFPRWQTEGAWRALRYETLSDPPVASPREFVEIRPVLSGICGSDLGVLYGKSSPYLAPFTGFPAVLGHEVIGRVADSDAEWPRNTLVAVNPTLSCRARGLSPCRACEGGLDDLCERRADPGLGPGMMLGYHGTLPGGWSTRMWVPKHQMHPVPDRVPLKRAALTEPLAIVLAALQDVDWASVQSVWVVGAGTIGLLTTAALAQAGRGPVTVIARHAHQGQLARQFGASAVVGEQDSDALAATRGPAVAPPQWNAPPYFPWGPDLVIDTVGTPKSYTVALTSTRPGGQVLVLGGLGTVHVDLTPLWTRHLTIRGAWGYGHPAGSAITAALERMEDDALPLEQLVTHIFSLQDYKAAVDAFSSRPRQALKVLFAPNGPV